MEAIIDKLSIYLELATDEDEVDETIAFANGKKKSPFMLTVSCLNN